MRVIIQRSLQSNVKVDGKIVGEIEKGLVILVGFTYDDTIEDIKKMVDKIIHLRIFDDDNGVMNRSLLDVGGEVLSVSQFTLYADTKKGRRPSYMKALRGEEAIHLYDQFNLQLKDHNINVSTGIFGADMKVSITNDGPITIALESEEWHVKK
ncbi:MAG TPA: D-tyrosyl-tRNA(Tyr) deacylase [Candidatus Fimihabitans intestinipullorum]|uniref:D-aminoacyl-tRNA deacylase n=1 Tax=Candidatus Fimihabitans intestinipullorum TaxID=2840820 RepID=A0A9D1HVQ6_9BACT|nr:D-tyrosyl-tRNA(Tyr) deacylase [Candidatus Fimihabitans intestinipullorum]